VPAYGRIINGEKVLSKDSFEVVNPAMGGAFAECPKASIDQLNQAVVAAREALPQWSGLADEKRVEILNQISQIIEANQAELSGVGSEFGLEGLKAYTTNQVVSGTKPPGN
jgi:acyl-CoA reductase-like NAD-dependent aldehyde dehydrogenase